MSSIVDLQYIGLIASHLRLLTRKGDVWNFRCPFCGDSKKNPRLCRGFLLTRSSRIVFKCHNCSLSMGFAKFLLQLDPQLSKAYKFDLFKERGQTKVPRSLPIAAAAAAAVAPQSLHTPHSLSGLSTLWDLREDHPARVYAASRRLPLDAYTRIFVTDCMRDLERLDLVKYSKVLPEDCRLILPYYSPSGDLIGLTGRSIATSPKKRYIQMRLIEDVPLIFGWPHWVKEQPTYVTEGPIDSLFLPNALACGGVDIQKVLEMDLLDPRNTTIVFDHQPRNPHVVRQMYRLIKTGWPVTVWPGHWPYKDINEAIMQGIPRPAIQTIIDANTHHGLALDLAIHAWRKC